MTAIPSRTEIRNTRSIATNALEDMKSGVVPSKNEFLQMVNHAAITGQDSAFTRTLMVVVQEMENDPNAAIEQQFDRLKFDLAGMKKSEISAYQDIVAGYLILNPEYAQALKEWEEIKAEAPDTWWAW